MKCFPKILAVLVGSLLLSSCFSFAPSRTYEDTSDNVEVLDYDSHNIDRIKPLRMRISSSKIWQNTGVFVQRGDLVTVSAYGTWSPWPEMALWTGPDGNDLWSQEVSSISGSALMARLGYQGKPFQLGSSKTFRARDYGMLYMAMNDPFKHLYNNKGELNVSVYVDANNHNPAGASASSSAAYKVTAYHYDDSSGKGYISAVTGSQNFAVRQWLLNKIGEIASTKNVALDARKNRAEGGAYRVTNEKVANGVLSIEFETIW